MNRLDKNTQVLAHMYEYCLKIKNTVDRFGNSFEVFIDDNDFKDSISMNLLQIGELVTKLSDDFIRQTSERMPWREMKGMRNFFAHDYGSMNVEIIWETVISDIPSVGEFCKPYYNAYQKACEEAENF